MCAPCYILKQNEQILRVRVQPGAERSEVELGDGELKVRLRARPVDGAANAALIGLLSDVTGTPKNRIAILRGDQSRLKLVRISASAPTEAFATLEHALGETPA